MDRKHELNLRDGGNVECPVDGCGCPWVKFRGTEAGTYPDGGEYTRLSFECEWDHEWSLTLNMHDGATLHRIESRPIRDEPMPWGADFPAPSRPPDWNRPEPPEPPPAETNADRIWRER